MITNEAGGCRKFNSMAKDNNALQDSFKDKNVAC